MIFASQNSKVAGDGDLREKFFEFYEQAEKTENPGWTIINKFFPESQIEQFSTFKNKSLYHNIKFLSKRIPGVIDGGIDRNNLQQAIMIQEFEKEVQKVKELQNKMVISMN